MKYFIKLIPQEGKGEVGDTVSVLGLIGKITKITDKEVEVNGTTTYHSMQLGLNIVTLKPCVCTRDIYVGDKNVFVYQPSGIVEIPSTELLEIFSVELVDILRKEVDGVYIETLKVKQPTLGEFVTPIENGLKVIGELSAKATWVKDGDEFNEDQLEFKITDHPPFEGWRTVPLKEFIHAQCWMKKIKVLGPCGHFH